MKLFYRGVSYNYEPANVETRDGAIAGKYRGAALKFRTNKVQQPVLQRNLNLIYRGTRYQVNPTLVAAANQTVTTNKPRFHTPVELVYRGVNYSAGNPPVAPAPVAANQPQLEGISHLSRELLIQLRQRREQRDQSVLARFQAAVGASADDWRAYRHHDAAMS